MFEGFVIICFLVGILEGVLLYYFCKKEKYEYVELDIKTIINVILEKGSKISKG